MLNLFCTVVRVYLWVMYPLPVNSQCEFAYNCFLCAFEYLGVRDRINCADFCTESETREGENSGCKILMTECYAIQFMLGWMHPKTSGLLNETWLFILIACLSRMFELKDVSFDKIPNFFIVNFFSWSTSDSANRFGKKFKTSKVSEQQMAFSSSSKMCLRFYSNFFSINQSHSLLHYKIWYVIKHNFIQKISDMILTKKRK